MKQNEDILAIGTAECAKSLCYIITGGFILKNVVYPASNVAKFALFIQIQIQKTWRGFYSRKYKFDSSFRKQYFADMEVENARVRLY